LLEAYVLLEPPDYPKHMRATIHGPLALERHRNEILLARGVERKPRDGRRLCRIYARRHDTYDLVAASVEQNRFADNVVVGPKAALPQTVIEDDHLPSPRFVFFRKKRTPEGRLNAKR